MNQMSKRNSIKNWHDYSATGSMTLVCVQCAMSRKIMFAL